MMLNNIQRPSLLPAACAPSVSELAPARVAVPAAERAPMSRAHQVQIQAELVLAGGVYGSDGTTGSVDTNSLFVKPMTDDARGVPPRGRPV